jgi:hypothetical protein
MPSWSLKMKKLVVVVVLLVGAVIVVGSWSKKQQPAQTSSATVADHSAQETLAQMQTHEYAAKDRVPAYYEVPPNSRALAPTLSPELFTGNKKLAYQAAKDIPQTLAQLPCYCHCDRGHGHRSLHSCFESEHGENCGICMGEALMAYDLEKRGVSVSEIRKKIIAAYGQSQ